MNILIVLAHPETSSFNHALALEARKILAAQDHSVRLTDLYSEHFNPLVSRSDFAATADRQRFEIQTEQRLASETPETGFAPDLRSQHEKLFWCDLLILQFPIWWFSVPAILKGWFDRCLASGLIYGGGRWFDTAPLAGRRALISATTGGNRDRWQDNGLFGDIDRALYPLRVGTLNFVGFDVLPHHIVYGPRYMSSAGRRQALDAWAKRLVTIESETALASPKPSDYPDPGYRN